MTGPALLHALATSLNGTVDGLDILLPGGGVITCRPTGRVILDGSWQLGSVSDGADLLAAKARMVVREVAA